MKTNLIFFVSFFAFLMGFSQQDAQFTQYMYNTSNVNPAYAGSRDVLSIFALHRTQWVGLDGAPVTNTVNINTPIGSNIGLGLGIIKDRIGVSDENNIATDLSYTIQTSDNYKLAFGIKLSVNILNIAFNKLSFAVADPSFETNVNNKISPNLGAGLYLYSYNTYFGISVPNFLETRHYDRTSTINSAKITAQEKMHFYLIAGHVFDLSENIQFKSSILSKIVQGSPLQIDASANFMFNQKFVLGGAYRWSAAASLMAGFQVNDSWFIGYGYDLETTKLATYNSGSHEIFLRYELPKQKIIHPRFF
jgi:type IX secretion system PorP/SprF family membrane protein